ncbi:MAG: hypothetical protein UW46_C0006G0002 [Candidatus Yanofskybacteria bacterium GW2011_GWF1_44_227]|uniref:Uncharacterized protein n=1 Tax=Candidatus Yanofskybacteria bacterium GW2011_GWE2_40_11 TaxID=1619033 RepID=A0A0G0QUH6_9BACT|nr:MAG: hypothetical protein UT75_C0002G0053 [Candidatus Yanofskybacteria bacterium GW2011_GWE2_40_11]KKT15483.1 MAG: hypothetical protein UV97_C0006G0050 [Candidatus Yanofskybacteria bacterium GW2011_GWF2_43_596]KKT53101.1 MAG: hypothetical protein UW46_C0006G0002 [Candidatus Yanofskybacteria bacterium GW2011_GWF1_44_227]
MTVLGQRALFFELEFGLLRPSLFRFDICFLSFKDIPAKRTRNAPSIPMSHEACPVSDACLIRRLISLMDSLAIAYPL